MPVEDGANHLIREVMYSAAAFAPIHMLIAFFSSSSSDFLRYIEVTVSCYGVSLLFTARDVLSPCGTTTELSAGL